LAPFYIENLFTYFTKQPTLMWLLLLSLPPLLVFPAKGRGLGQPEGHAFFSLGSSLVGSGKITSFG